MKEYRALPKEERTVLRRAAYGMSGLDDVCEGYNLAALRDMLDAENAKTGDFGTKWTHSSEDDDALDLLR